MFLFLSPLTFFGLPLFLFPFLCLSVPLFFLPSFLSFFFAFFLFLVFVSFFPYLSSLLLFHEKKNMKIFNCNLFSWNIFSFFWFPVLLFCFKSLFLIFAFFLILSYVFSSTSMFLVSKITNWEAQKNKKKQIATKRGFFMNLCFAKCEKLSFFFFCPVFANFWLMFKKHYKNRYFSKFLKAKNWKKNAFWGVIIWAK